MTKTQYLDMRGFDPEDWQVLLKDDAAELLDKKGAVNMMYDVKEPKAISVFGSGAYVVNIKWASKFSQEEVSNKTETIVDVQEVSQTKETPVVPLSPPPPPPVPKSAAVPPPPKPEEEVPKKSGLLLARISKLEKLGYVDNGLSLDKNGDYIFYKDIEEMSNDEWDKFLLPESEDVSKIEMIDENQINREDKRDLPWEDFKCDKFDNTGEACSVQCDFCKNAEKSGETIDQYKETAKKELEKIVEESGVPKEKVIIASVPKIETSEPQNIDSGKVKLRVNLLIKAGMELSDDLTELYQGGIKIVVSDLKNLTADQFEETLRHTQEASKKIGKENKIPLNEDGSVDTSEMEEADAREAIIEHQKQISGSEGKGKAVGTLTAKKEEDAEVIETVENEKPEKESKAKKEPKEKKSKIETPVIVAKDSLIEQIKIVETLIEVSTTFKKTFYAIESIKEVVSMSWPDERKLENISEIINNLEK